jgi:hypothetical protein
VWGLFVFLIFKRKIEMIIYQGKSLLDSKTDIVCIATGAENNSNNIKTGGMLQTWILNANVDPVSANRTGADISICGHCIHKGHPKNPNENRGFARKRSCYVNLVFAPNQIFKTYKRGGYPIAQKRADLEDLGRKKIVRLGAYGDPAAVPRDIWEDLLKYSSGRTGYSHQIIDSNLQLNQQFAPLADICMISADTIEQARIAWSQGLRTYRVVSDLSDVDRQKEIICPASKEAGAITTCAKCKLCSGSKGKAQKARSVAIVVHGAGKKHFSTNSN